MMIPMKSIKSHLNMMKFAGMLLLLGFMAYSCEDLLGPDTGDDRDKLVDTWKVTEESSPLKSGQGAYWVEIEKHPDNQNFVRYTFFLLTKEYDIYKKCLDESNYKDNAHLLRNRINYGS